MKLIVDNIKIPVEKDSPGEYRKAVYSKLGIPPWGRSAIKILRKSLDARRKNQFFFSMSFAVDVPEKFRPGKNFRVYVKDTAGPFREPLKLETPPVIVGLGPAGLFSALTFVKYGVKPVVLERGKNTDEREKDLKCFLETGRLDPESNIQFGEGGAGAYSDGKLTSRSRETGYVSDVLETLVSFGAPSEILYLNKPHLGTDILLRIIPAIRRFLQDKGAKISFSSKVTGLLQNSGSVSGVVVNGSDKYFSDNVILASGHSARDTYAMLLASGIDLEQKPFAIGSRIEHPSSLINLMQYGEKYKNHPALGAADYALTYQDTSSGRGVFSFCVCPGGEVINASSGEGLAVVNGMSSSRRNSDFSNSAIVVSVGPPDYGASHPLAGLEFQKKIELLAFTAGGGSWKAPAENLMDFLKDGKSLKLNPNSFRMGTVPARLEDFLPEIITSAMRKAFGYWKTKVPLFISEKAVLIGAETRTSSPVRITRGENRQSTSLKGLYPAGEGSGYSGGIVSSAIDGIKAAEKVLGII